MTTIGTLFSGFDGVGEGAKALHRIAWGVELDDAIASVARYNGHPVRTLDILQANPVDFEKVDVLHASPPCPSFSVAKAGAEETEQDRALATAVCSFIEVLQPPLFTLENVLGYRKADSFKRIVQTLNDGGYGVSWWKLNAADYGVPQTRKRLILAARLNGRPPQRPAHTHAPAEKLAPLFDERRPWIGWYAAVEDILDTLPLAYKKKGELCPHDPDGKECRESPYCRGHFADWQLKRLPDEYRNLLFSQGISRDHHGEDYGSALARGEDEPTFGITANHNQVAMRAYLMGGANTSKDQADGRARPGPLPELPRQLPAAAQAVAGGEGNWQCRTTADDAARV